MVLADPWEEENVIAEAVQGYENAALQPDRNRLSKSTRGSQMKSSLNIYM